MTRASEKGKGVRVFNPLVEGRVIDGFRGLAFADRMGVKLPATEVERRFVEVARIGA